LSYSSSLDLQFFFNQNTCMYPTLIALW
jgi:hypothetical protein